MSCERVEELLSAYLEGGLGAEDKWFMDAHLGTCPGCRALLAALTETRAALNGFPELEISASLRVRLLAIPEKKRRFSFGLDFVLRPSLQPVFAAAALLMTLGSFYLFGPYKTAIDRTVDRTIHQGYGQVEKLVAKAGSLRDRLADRKDNLLASIKNLELLGGSQDQSQ
jgi:hypothetical protein